MKSVVHALFVVTCLAPVLPAYADDGGGAPVTCVGANTYMPRGDKWCLLPTDSIPILYQPDGPVQPAATALSGATANAAIQSAFNTWASAPCSSSTRPNIRFTVGSYAGRDHGDDALTLALQHTIYFVTQGILWEADSLTVALTTNLYQTDNQYAVDADMEFNNQNFNWRVGTTGCNVADGNCYDVQTVALHEAGHFLGFNHTNCTDSVMYPAAYGQLVNSALSHHEIAGICALYPPRTGTNTTISLQGEGCKTAGDCAKGLDCLLASNVSPNNPNGWCAKPCSTTSDCGNAYVCGPFGVQSTNYCHPGFHLPDVPTPNITATDDLCAPCTDGAQCSTGLCGGQNAQGTGICTQSCASPSFACPDGFECSPTNVATRNVCLPTQTSTCQLLYTGVQINDLCLVPTTTSNPNAAFRRDCQPGLACFTFISTYGACVDACSSVDPSMQCGAGFHCCYGVDASGGCLGTSPTAPVGGCFQTRVAGDSCVLPNQSICDSTTSCFTSGAAEDARCYNFCDSGPCGAGETCVKNAFSNGNNGALSVCCDVASWDPKNLSTCVPHAAPCQRQESVTCNNNGDCLSGYCLKLSSGAACSVNCTSDADCSAAGTDVNNDGVGDAGSHCDAAQGNRCVPNGAPVTAPACAAPTVAAKKAGCSNCAQGGPMGLDGLAWGAVLLVCALRMRRRSKA